MTKVYCTNIFIIRPLKFLSVLTEVGTYFNLCVIYIHRQRLGGTLWAVKSEKSFADIYMKV